jgi:hypothetical protein
MYSVLPIRYYFWWKMTSGESSVTSMPFKDPLLSWWLVLIQGIVTLILGIFLLTSPYLLSGKKGKIFFFKKRRKKSIVIDKGFQ